ncbi:hypothetical protein LK07_28790 [Streptomyces pluripotens]|uniref:Uncharacterized protein n=1 Tax=Streptomyces pluripotens TaxID=1355015 RepID=A0A221P5B2_9ACTN|nr:MULTISPECIES: phosphotransferase [Streptomyces]ARP73119.1 hypothetical protein LK06_027620 [Streptomyces pluripotens]ASN27370.1 hypothetical protein LK07_28790 [Streptomyces pluripotens]MCH0558117.1 phosphotransferase [Streptomyces sp. MUM 16J]
MPTRPDASTPARAATLPARAATLPGPGSTRPTVGPGTGIRVPAGERLVRELGTRHIVTAVLAVPEGGYVWARRPGPARDVPLPLPGDAWAARVRAASAAAPVGLAPAAPDAVQAGVLRYRAPGVRSVAAVLREDRDPDAQQAVRDAVRGLGTTLRLLHTGPTPGGEPAAGPAAVSAAVSGTGPAAEPGSGSGVAWVPPAPARLARWLRTGTGPGVAARLHAAARAHLGDRRLRLVAEWSESAAHGPGPRVLLHGGPAFGNLVLPSGDGGPADRPVLFTGEELTLGTWEFDLAWQLAEIEEMAAGERWGVCGPADYTALAQALLEGYGTRPSPAAVHRALVIRSLTHAHDFASYVVWHEQLLVYLDLVAEAMDTAETVRARVDP